MEFLKDKKIIVLTILGGVILLCSIIAYGKYNNKVFKDEYMKNIFVEEENDIVQGDLLVEPTSKEIVVEIKGEVNKPDVYRLQDGSIIKDLIDMAGGLTSEADLANINRAKQLQNHELIIIGNINSNDDSIATSGSIVQMQANDGLISINNASAEELKKIPGIGDVKAQSIIDYRDKNGGFKDLEEMKNIDGIGEKTFEKMKDKIKL